MFFNGWWRGGGGGGCSGHACDLCFAIINAKELSPPDTSSLYTSYSAMQCNFWSGTVLAFQESLSSTTHKILSACYYPSVEVSRNSYFVASQYRPFLHYLLQ